MTLELQSLRDQVEERKLQAEAAELSELLRVMDLEARHIPESAGWGEVIPYSDYPDYDEPFYNRNTATFTRLEDRQEGRYMPVFQTEQDLSRIRALARYLAPATSVAVGAQESLYNYVFAKGFEYTVQPEQGAPELPTGLAEAVQNVVNEFLDFNGMAGLLDHEVSFRTREDGEQFLHLKSKGKTWKAIPVDPDQVTEPANTRPLDDWLSSRNGLNIPTSWTFGVHSPLRDCSEPLGYHVIYDGAGREWEYVPASQMLHIKRNVPISVKRGVSDFYPISRDILADDKLTRNMGTAAAVIAAIVGVRKMAKGTLSGDADGLLSSKSGGSVTRLNRNGQSRTVKREPYEGGSILNAGGFDWVNGPLGAQQNSSLLLVSGLLRRSIGVRWTMPEYLISGDASNANYASTSIAAESWVNAREADQRFYGRQMEELLWKVIHLAWSAGRFDRFGLDWRELLAWLDISTEFPKVSTGDYEKALNAELRMVETGNMSKRSFATSQGLDFDQEQENIKQDGDQPVSPALQGGVSKADLPAR